LIDSIFEQHLDKNIDFCSIDIDGLDLDIFETFEINLPKVVCIEGGQTLAPYHSRVSSDVSRNNIQQSLSVMNSVFEAKGYKLLCSYQDSFFIKEEYHKLFNVDESLMNQYIDGLLALPRLPYIKKLLAASGLINEVVEQAILDIPAAVMSRVMNQGTKEDKMKWVDDYYLKIKERLAFLKK